ncbi:MAG: beta-galactosidase [Elusimicrobiota bacterium]
MKIELINNMILLNQKPFFVYSGEMHYFRIEKKYWRAHLLKAKKAGLNTISSYIPWCIHEKEEGEFNFDELLAFIKLLKELNLYFIARVGPASNAELICEGLPKWLYENYPQVYVKAKELAKLTQVTLISYHNPTYLKFVERWYSKLLPLISEFQIEKNGPIILAQLCNEIGVIQWLHKAPDYSENTEKMYRNFLQDKYGTINKLNNSYDTKYQNFDEISQPNNEAEKEKFLLYCDWIYFYCDYYARYFGILYTTAKKFGITVPVIANIPQFYDFDVRGRGIYSPMTTIMFKNFIKYVPDVIFGGAYQMRELDWENFHDVAITTEVVKMVSSPHIPSMCCELQTGILLDRPKIYSQDVELNLKTSTAHGLNGLNCYMFSGGKDQLGTGIFGSYHEWQAPVSSEGKERLHFKPIKLFGTFIKSFGSKLAQTKKMFDTTIGFYPPYYATELLQGKFINELEMKRNNFFFDGIARLVQLAGFNYNFVNLETIAISELKKIPHLWVFSLEFMDFQTEQKLVEFVKCGGKLVIGPSVTQNIAKSFGFSIQNSINENIVFVKNNPARLPTKKLDLRVKDNRWGSDVYTVDKVQVYSAVAEDEIISKTVNNLVCGLKRKIGKGEVVVFGFGITHLFNYHIDIIKYFADMLGIKRTIELTNSNISATLRSSDNPTTCFRIKGMTHNYINERHDKFGFLFLHNYHRQDEMVSVKLVLPGETKYTKIPEISMFRSTAQILPLNVSLSEQIKIRYSNIEVLNYKIDGKFLSLDVHAPSTYNAEIELKYPQKPKSVKINSSSENSEKKVSVKYFNGTLKIKFSTNGNLQNIVIQ